MPGARKWASDAPISEPGVVDPRKPGHVSLGSGWTFTSEGMKPDLTEDVAEYLFTPTYAPKHRQRD